MSVRKLPYWVNLGGTVPAEPRQHHALDQDSRQNEKEKASIHPFQLLD